MISAEDHKGFYGSLVGVSSLKTAKSFLLTLPANSSIGRQRQVLVVSVRISINSYFHKIFLVGVFSF